MNILDRFLALVKLRKGQLQLLGSVCLFIASKLRQSKTISPQKLIYYTDWSITLNELTVCFFFGFTFKFVSIIFFQSFCFVHEKKGLGNSCT